ncbi:DUF1178 family protein [Sphingomonas sp.]|uniref:DUF1178 family protein n=1 Tax=Sphingomonas sp. TaxID=28214 RepID=UPI003B00A71D
MIVFDLACGGGHVFEAWFGSAGDYDSQRERGLVSCPICGNGTIDKAPMAPRIGAGGSRTAPTPEQAKSMMRALATAQAKALAGSEHVGRRFATEARAIHEGDAEARPIHGQATLAEAKALAADGVPVAPLPLPVREPAREN